MKTCLKRLEGICKDCELDLDLNHHPNNYDCRDYVEIEIIEIYVKEKREHYIE